MTTATAGSGVDQERSTASTTDAAQSPIAPPDYYVRVTVTIAIPRNGPLARIMDETDLVLRGLSTISKDILPQGTHLQGSILTSARTVKELIADEKRRVARRAKRGY